ncbi:MAG TPA: SIR2 family protein [Longimicrobium sp.]|nr:SIR2 family protein [Longimicrobium sp.]
MSRALLEGRVVPFFGAGVNLCGRPDKTGFEYGRYLPSGYELAEEIAESYQSGTTPAGDLLQVAQYVATMQGDAVLYESLRAIFDANYPPTTAHTFFAGLPARLRARNCPRTRDQRRRRLLIVTTNYDDVLERAFLALGERFHVVSYVAMGPDRGKFLHFAPHADQPGASAPDPVVVHGPEDYQGLQDELPVVLKIHGAIDRTREDRDSYVITEDDYIDYLTRTDVTRLLPNPLPAQLQSSRFLFLGYSLKDWNLRAMVHRLWRERTRSIISWSIVKQVTELERRFWLKRDIEIIVTEMQTYLEQLSGQLDVQLAALPELSDAAAGAGAEP